jgi:peptidoglycan glycosyltransferase
VNDQIVKLFGFVLVLFALLVFFTSRWTVFDASALNNNRLNHLTAIRDAKIKRGLILADNGEVLAKSVPTGGGEWARSYPQGSLFAQTVGYWRGSGDDAGLESYYANRLNGKTDSISSVFGPLSSSAQVGDTMHTTLDPKAQLTARSELAGRVGAVVALQPRTGAVLAMYANPTFNPNSPNGQHCGAATCSFFNRATQSAYPPGSTFKIVTAGAAINTGKYTPNSPVNGAAPAVISGVPLNNAPGDPQLGQISLTYALTQSINTAWARVGVSLGIPVMTQYMKRYGFYADPPIDLPRAELRASDVLSPAGVIYPEGSPNEDIGRISIGQGGLAVTPLQMAMVVAAVANHGTLMRPYLVRKVVNQVGQTVTTTTPTVYSQVMKPQIAAELTQMMRKVVEEGTGTAANLQGLAGQVAGKTGTAQVGGPSSQYDDAWFVGFAPISDPKIAVAVVLPHILNGYGGTYAAPVVAQMIKALLAEGM